MELKNPDTFGVYGRLLAVMETANNKPFPSATLLLYYQKPLFYFVKLHSQSMGNLRRKPDLDERFMLLMNQIHMEDIEKFEANKTISLEDEGQLQIAYYHEKTFLDSTIGERIKRGRSELNLTQEELATKAGIKGGSNTISRYEIGEVKPGSEAIAALRKVLGYKYI